MTDAQVSNILIIGDWEAAEHHVRRLLALGSFRCTCTSDPGEARAAAVGPWLDAALVDLSGCAPEAGLSLVGSLRRDAVDLPLVLIGREPGRMVFEALRLGVVDYLRAPVAADELLEAIARAVQWRRDARLGREAGERCAREMGARADALVRASVETGIESSRSLRAWLAALYDRDVWTAGHVRRVTDLSVLIGTMLGVDAPTLDQVERAALLHDVGRLAVPDALIRKPGPLTDAERTLMRTHVQVAYEIAAASPFLEPVATALFAVRERYDGSGYPLGLRGEAIPLAARIIAVAEGLDALGSAAMVDPAEADIVHATMVRAAGACFDPAIVRSWLRCVDSGVCELMTRGRDASLPEVVVNRRMGCS